jgi:hypothetical protein
MRSVGKSARKAGKEFAQSVMRQLRDLTEESLGELANQIPVRHPRSRLRNLTERNVGDPDTKAILDAMEDEAQLRHVTMAQAGRTMLVLLDAWDDIPQEKWQYAAIPTFYKRADYRLPPRELLWSDR